jgi:diphthamide biosynthesis protein 7
MIILAVASQHQLHPKMTSIKSLCSLTLDLPPSCIEFWPSEPEYAVAGTYNLEKQTEQEQADAAQDEGQKKSQSRNGSLILVHVDGDNVYVAMSDVVGMLANNLQ